MKKFFIFLSFSLLAFVSQADVLYWQVAPSSPVYEYAIVKMTNASGGNETYLVNYISGSSEQFDAIDYNQPPVKIAAEIGNDYAGLSFIVELYNESDEVSYVSNAYQFNDLGTYIREIADFSSTWTSMNALQITEFHTPGEPVPEPTSGLLMLMGAALLGLRRQKRA